MRVGINAEHVENRFFAVAAVATAVDADGRQFAAFAPALDGEGGDTEKFSDLRDSKKVRKVFEIKVAFGHLIYKVTVKSNSVKTR